MKTARIIFLISATISSCISKLNPNLTNFDTDYCSFKCDGEAHTMCKYQGHSSSCVDFNVTYNPALGEKMLDSHNNFRNLLASKELPNQKLPEAANMRLMVWDPELTKIVHRWISQCDFRHDGCRWLSADERVGQNIGYQASSPNWPSPYTGTFGDWANEMEDVTPEMISSLQPPPGKVITHFTQLAWHNTYRVGCSEVTYTKSGMHHRYVGCNYAPAGNMVGDQVYKSGPPCSDCPPDTKCGVVAKYKNLCGKVGDDGKQNFELFDSGSGGEAVTARMTTITAALFAIEILTNLV